MIVDYTIYFVLDLTIYLIKLVIISKLNVCNSCLNLKNSKRIFLKNIYFIYLFIYLFVYLCNGT